MGLKLSYADFFPGERFSEADEPLLRLAPNNFLVYGPHDAGLSTLLFHYAFSCASAGHHVTIVAPRGALDHRPPMLTDEKILSLPQWSLINLKYLDSASNLVKYASLLHMSTLTPSLPHVLLVYDLERICLAETSSPGTSGPADATLCKILAVLTDSMEFIEKSTGHCTQMACFLPISHSTSDAPRPLHILLRWLPLALRCHDISMSNVASHESPHETNERHNQTTYQFEVCYAPTTSHTATQQGQISSTREKNPAVSILYSINGGLVFKGILQKDAV